MGTMPAGQYGAGTVAIWDEGTYDSLPTDQPVPQTVTEGIAAGRLELALYGKKLQGRSALIRMRSKGQGQEHWLLIKMQDECARPAGHTDIATRERKSARSGKRQFQRRCSGRN